MEKQFHFYYDPEKAGVEQIWLHDNYNPKEDYSYDIIALFQEKKTKKLYWGITQGCSCNSPFEDETLDELTELTPKTAQAFLDDLSDHFDMNTLINEKTGANELSELFQKLTKIGIPLTLPPVEEEE